jgi:hypothetical protein
MKKKIMGEINEHTCRDASVMRLYDKTKSRHGKPKSAGNDGFKRHNKMKFMKTERMRRLKNSAKMPKTII